MGTFSNFLGVHESYIDDPNLLPYDGVDSLMEDASIEPCFEDNFAVAASRICYENTVNMNSIFQAAAIQEFAYYEETGEELVYEAGTASSFFQKAKDFFKKLWEKIQQIFKKAIMMFNTKAKDDKEFYAKYKTEINKAATASYGDKEISIYDYIFYGSKSTEAVMTGLFSSSNMDGTLKDINSDQVNNVVNAMITASPTNKTINDWITNIAKLNDNNDDTDKTAMDNLDEIVKSISESDYKNDLYDEFRAALVTTLGGKPGTGVTSKDFANEIAEACQQDSTKDDVSMSVAIRKAADYLENSNKIVKGLDKCLKEWNRSLKQIIKDLENKDKEFSKVKDRKAETRANGYRHTVYSNAIQIMKEVKNIGVSFHGNVMQQIKACSAQSKSICVQAVHYKKPKNESSIYTSESTGSLLDNVELL